MYQRKTCEIKGQWKILSKYRGNIPYTFKNNNEIEGYYKNFENKSNKDNTFFVVIVLSHV